MESFDPRKHIRNSQLIIDQFGTWLSLHDSTVTKVNFSPGKEPSNGSDPASGELRITFHHFQMTREVTSEGFFRLTNHTLSEFLFSGVKDLAIGGIRVGSVVLEADFDIFEHPSGIASEPRESPPFAVQILEVYGEWTTFRCNNIEVLSSKPCDSNSHLIANPT